ncbi:MAG: valine--tRNA ligase [Prevotella sp.]|nr:valine--tRNA ligase [Prevotella sp.]MEE1121308.1 valine--tRNA ligase [Prevotella sp.]
MELAKNYSPKEVESKWYEYWNAHKLFSSKPDSREPYTIVIPPPNVTGVLHMGHMLNNTIQDILIRKARLDGKNACWVPGTDHASIATEAKVVNKLSQQGIKKSDLTREEFLKHAWEWTEEHGGIILKQLRRLGASCDWDRTAFTMDEKRSESVLKVFVDLYEKGYIYRGLRMVNWDPKAQTVLSTEEVIYREEKSKLFHLKYYVADADVNPVILTGDEEEVCHKDDKGYYAIVATTRPETIMGDTAMCINPKDPKNQWLKGHKVIVPLVNRVVPVIEDRYVDIEFGTGCLKVTPAHDINDYQLGKTHNLETIDIFNPDGTLSEAAVLYVGQDRMDVRKQIAKDLESAGLLDHIEDYVNKVGYSERNQDTAVEPRLCKQWFLSMQHMADIALPPVLNGELKFYPQKYVTTYKNWLENIQDWCISRQLWWGHRIPAYFLPETEDGEERFVVALTKEEAVAKAKAIDNSITADQVIQDEDALDTWFSSWLWPISLFDGITNPGNEEISYYYPTADLVTGPDIIFFWVARMIMAGCEYQKEIPFRNVYFTGIVRDKLGRKMSKSLGNSPDPLQLIDKYGADGVRMGMMLAAPAGNDILYDDALCAQGMNFCNKMWNAFRLVKGWEVAEMPQPAANAKSVTWMLAKIKEVYTEINDHFSKYRLNDALMAAFKLFTDEFSGWYLEMIKPAYQAPIDAATYKDTLNIFDQLLHIIHPFMPFITEELWQHIAERKEGESLMVSEFQLTQPDEEEQQLIKLFEDAKQVISGVRGVRQTKNISPREPLALEVIAANETGCDVTKHAELNTIITKMAVISGVSYVSQKSEGTSSFLIGTQEYAIPLGDLIDTEAELSKAQAELKHLEGFLIGIQKKLSNERFVSNAPEQVVALERKKESDTIEKITALKETIANLTK